MNRQEEIVIKRRFPYESLNTKKARLTRVVDDRPKKSGMLSAKTMDLIGIGCRSIRTDLRVEHYNIDHVPWDELADYDVPRRDFVNKCKTCPGGCSGREFECLLESTGMAMDTWNDEDPNLCLIKRRGWRMMNLAMASKGSYVRKVGGLSYGSSMMDLLANSPVCDVCSWKMGMHGYTFDSLAGHMYVRGTFQKRPEIMLGKPKHNYWKHPACLKGSADKWLCGPCFRQHWIRSCITANANQPVKAYTKFMLELSYYIRYRNWWIIRCLLRTPIGWCNDLVCLIMDTLKAEEKNYFRSVGTCMLAVI